jgi:hypothetical protein
MKVTRVLTKLITTGNMATSLNRHITFSSNNSKRLAKPDLRGLG